MAANDIIQIRIGNFPIGIIGLKEAMTDLAPTLGKVSDQEMAEGLLRRLAKQNYIPEKARTEYGCALVREFKKFLGQEISNLEKPKGLVIKVLGQGCANCQALSQRIMEVLGEWGQGLFLLPGRKKPSPLLRRMFSRDVPKTTRKLPPVRLPPLLFSILRKTTPLILIRNPDLLQPFKGPPEIPKVEAEKNFSGKR
ncbi:MAG: hypothetical protein HY787_25795 [Deltaproteobacteria bacterium]|nr:hypothetical protein [Deltaproteobacteria bacterium]